MKISEKQLAQLISIAQNIAQQSSLEYKKFIMELLGRIQGQQSDELIEIGKLMEVKDDA